MRSYGAPSELGVARRTREGYHVTDVGHAGNEEQQTLEAQTEAGVGT